MEENTIRVNYKRPKFGRRVLANVIDFLFFVLMFFILFLSCRAIVNVTPKYEEAFNHVNEVKLASGIFKKAENGRIIDICTYGDGLKQSDGQKVYNIKMAMKEFTQYVKDNGEPKDSADKMISRVEEIALTDEKLVNDQGIRYFYRDPNTNEIVNNPECKGVTLAVKYDKFYRPIIQEVMEPYLHSSIPMYHQHVMHMSKMLFFVELPISYLTSGILVWFVPTLIFRKGRKTFGKAIYYIGVVDSRLLNPKFGRSFARFAIFYFGELVLSLFTFGIPVLISFTMMAFSKNRQSFPDYMLGLYEVDTSDNKIFDSYDDVTINEVNHRKSPVDFKMERDL